MSNRQDEPEPADAREPLAYPSPEADRRPLVCPKCTGAMTRGFLADRSHDGAVRQSKWVEGVPEGALLGEFLTGVRTDRRDNLRVDTYRCVECGYLESYATEPF